jgi:hypothetical protein
MYLERHNGLISDGRSPPLQSDPALEKSSADGVME